MEGEIIMDENKIIKDNVAVITAIVNAYNLGREDKDKVVGNKNREKLNSLLVRCDISLEEFEWLMMEYIDYKKRDIADEVVYQLVYMQAISYYLKKRSGYTDLMIQKEHYEELEAKFRPKGLNKKK